MALNGISTLATKELRQVAKLDLAATNRAADGNARATYDITQLPTKYSGNSIVDNPNTGGLVEGRPWVLAPLALSLVFDGSSNRIQVGGTRADWNLAYSWTIEFWSKASVVSTTNTLLTPMSQQPNSGTIDILYYNGNLVVNNNTTLHTEPTVGVWTHVALVCTASGAGGLKLYYNGVNVATAAGYNLPDTANDLWIGRRGNNDFQYFNGKLANIRISNTPRYSATFTPPLTLVTDANTKLALDGNLVDRSASAHTITNTGTTTSSLDFPT